VRSRVPKVYKLLRKANLRCDRCDRGGQCAMEGGHEAIHQSEQHYYNKIHSNICEISRKYLTRAMLAASCHSACERLDDCNFKS
jgi:hypothetical protein